MKHRLRPAGAAALVVPLLVGSLLTAAPAEAVSGPVTADGAYAYTARIAMDGRACSGALISATWVITAASCFPENPQGGVPAKTTTVSVGRDQTAHVAKATTVVTRTDRDVALVHLDTSITDVTPLTMSFIAPIVGDTQQTSGYGRTATEWLPDTPHTSPFTPTTVTATTETLTAANGVDTCKGDAGAPLFRQAGTTTELVAVASTSWQHGCLGETGTQQGTTATRIDDLGDWIRQQVLVPHAHSVAHAITVTWEPLPTADNAHYSIYGATTPNVPLDAGHLLGDTYTSSYVKGSLTPHQTWYFRVTASTLSGGTVQPAAVTSATTPVPTTTDFNGDGKDDIATFTQGTTDDVYAATSDGTKFNGTSQKWDDFFSLNGEIPLTGDFNGDGKDDIVTFTRGTADGAWVALSDGTKFGASSAWINGFALNDQVPLVGDFNGDGKDDIATFTRGTTGNVYVALSDGTKFLPATLWRDSFAMTGQAPLIGDFNGDGKADIVAFARGSSGDVSVALSDGTKFQPATLWHDFFSINDEIPAVGDFNGDGKDDIATFTRGTAGNLYIALSDGTKFNGTSVLWATNFSVSAEIPGAGDFNGDGKSDVITFTRGTAGHVYAGTSDGTKFTSNLWHLSFCYDPEIPIPHGAI
jgi:hypothetical protein